MFHFSRKYYILLLIAFKCSKHCIVFLFLNEYCIYIYFIEDDEIIDHNEYKDFVDALEAHNCLYAILQTNNQNVTNIDVNVSTTITLTKYPNSVVPSLIPNTICNYLLQMRGFLERISSRHTCQTSYCTTYIMV